MLTVKGRVCKEGEGAGAKHFSRRMTDHAAVFERATGERLYAGTLNINVGVPIPAKEHFRIRGTEINEPDQDLLFEVCRINEIWAYRIRPFHLLTGGGGHGDHIIEIASRDKVPNVTAGTQVQITLFR